jgi:hypothetical protein
VVRPGNQTELAKSIEFAAGYSSCSGFLSAGAVDAAVFGAGATGEDELLLEGLAGSVGSDGGVAGGDAGFLCEGLERAF